MWSNLQTFKRSQLAHLLFAIIFFTSGIIINIIQCIFYLTIRPINKRIYRKINWHLCATLYEQLVFMGDWWSGSEILLYINKDDFDKYWGKENAYCVMNHTYEIDWLMGCMLCDRIHLLGNCKAFAKKVTQYMPVLGWAGKFSEFVFLERSFDKDKDVINRQIIELADHPDPIWLLLFPEGTRFTIEKHRASERFAREKNVPELKYHLQPRTRGFISSLPSMRGKIPAIYDILVAFKEDASDKPTMTTLLFGKSVIAHAYMKRIPMEDVPKSESEQEKFLRDMFAGKDRLKDSFVRTGDFFTLSGVQRLPPFKLKRRFHSIINMGLWAIITLCPMIYYLIRLFLSDRIVSVVIGTGIIILFMGLLSKIIDMSKISKGSSYGKENTPKKTQ